LKGGFFWGNRRVKLLQIFNIKIRWKSIISFFILCLILTGFSLISNLPTEINLIQGENHKFANNLLFNLSLENNKINIDALDSNFTGSIKGKLKLFGLLPMKNVIVNVISDVQVVPSGESIGVKIESKGILVVGLSTITDINGKKVSPAADGGFSVGDKILKINDENIENERDIIEIINDKENKGQKLKVSIERKGKPLELAIRPVQSNEDKLYKMGLWVRDNIAGVGTMTFYEPSSGEFGALGHGITDMDSGVLIDIDKGKILKSKVISIQRAKKAAPGEIVGLFTDSNGIYGVIDKNSAFGIYGVLEKNRINKKAALMPIALSTHVKEGPAKILTTIEDNRVEEFDIEIQKIFRQNNADSKSMIIRVTDKRLIEKTGGIVQGMSGSPIIQDGKLVGAVTHVLINDPFRGYGIFAEWMLNETNIDTSYGYKTVVGQ